MNINFMKKKIESSAKVDQIVVIGASAGGLTAISKLIQQLPANFAAPILIVQHISADATGNVLKDLLNKTGNLPCAHGIHGALIKPGQIYLAPSNHHLMVDKTGRLLVTKGAQENRSRPAIDPLFRSAAAAYGNRAIGIVLTGYLDDGTSGLMALQRCGGTCIVQDPADADYPDMPLNALNQVKPQYCIPIAQMGGVLAELLQRKPTKGKLIPKDIVREVAIVERIQSDLESVNSLGNQVPFNCPGCGGVLWKISNGPKVRYRCHTGHAYTAEVLMAEQNRKIEETMWTALRMFEEKRNLLSTVASQNTGGFSQSARERADSTQIHIDRIRAILLSSDDLQDGDSPI